MAVAQRRVGSEEWIGNLVDRAIEDHAHGSPSLFARKLSVYAGREISKQMVINWRRRGQISREMIMPFHKLTRIALSELLAVSD